jgi:hypothetical protein
VVLSEQGLLGWTTWMPKEVLLKDPDDLVLGPLERIIGYQQPQGYEMVTIEPTGAAVTEFVGF